MTYGIEPRRKRSSASSRRDESRDEAFEADNWLAGLRPGQDGRAEPDPFAADPFDEPYEPPARRRREPRETRAARDDATSAYRVPVDEPPSGGGRRRARDEEATDYGMAGMAAGGNGYVARRARDEEPPRDHVPELTPIMKPATGLQPQYAPTEPPPLTPIFPALGQPQPSVGKRRRSEPAPPPMPPLAPDPATPPARRPYEDDAGYNGINNGYTNGYNGSRNGMDTSGDIRRPRPRPAPAPSMPPVPPMPAGPPAPREPQGYAAGYAEPGYVEPGYA